MFAKVDANSDGGIDKSEMTDFAQKSGMDASKVDELFESADVDGNGQINETEHSDMMDKISEQMKDRLPPPPPTATDSTEATTSSNDALLKMMDHIRTQSEQSGGSENLRQFLSNLSQQSAAYDSTGSKDTASVPSLFSAVA
jgi:hypothetical protein